MGNPPLKWNSDIPFRVADALEQIVIEVNEQMHVVRVSRFVAQLDFDRDSTQIADSLITQIPFLTWQSFMDAQQDYLRLSGIFFKRQAYELVLVRMEASTLIYPILVDNVQQQMRQELAYLLNEANQTHNPDEIIGKTSKFLHLLYQIEQVADTSTNVLIYGEMGTGKELLARMIHNLSSRRGHPFFKINCASLSSDILERQLFGLFNPDKRMAYKNRKGLLEIASDGTIYLDKVETLSSALQLKLARLLKDGTFEPIATSAPMRSSARLLFSSKQDLLQLVKQDVFLEELYYLLQEFPLVIPPLRKRKTDIPFLLDYFCKKYAKKLNKKIKKPSAKSLYRFMQYDFPGNIRELENLVERAVLLSKNGILDLDIVLPDVKTIINKQGKIVTFLNFEEMQRKHILDALQKTNWRVSGVGSASELLELNPKTLTSKMRKLGIKRRANP